MNARKPFSFGKNWQRFLKSFDEERVRSAERSLTEFLGVRDLRGLSFIDIGCGSGLFSYAAYTLGAARIVSVDVDPFSVHCCLFLREKAGNPPHWEVREGSVLDDIPSSWRGTFDIVYSWGVLHHTGAMWRALGNAGMCVAEGGYLYLALYNKKDGLYGSEFWRGVKRLYNRMPRAGKYLMDLSYMGCFMASRLATARNPLKEIRGYTSHRGMSWRIDVSDWLGGLPYEYATVEEVCENIRMRFPDFELVNLKRDKSIGNNWFLFRKGPAWKLRGRV
ncbi:MAG: class I SAM-dependent methyltransferase [Chlamydiota bacterium]